MNSRLPLDISEKLIRQVRIALGGVATVPWRAREADAVLTGRRFSEAAAREAADAAFAQARPRTHNGFKVALGKESLVRALIEAVNLEQ
jgi:xanthine dehydrogenase YagS FAD-binding subunit